MTLKHGPEISLVWRSVFFVSFPSSRELTSYIFDFIPLLVLPFVISLSFLPLSLAMFSLLRWPLFCPPFEKNLIIPSPLWLNNSPPSCTFIGAPLRSIYVSHFISTTHLNHFLRSKRIRSFFQLHLSTTTLAISKRVRECAWAVYRQA